MKKETINGILAFAGLLLILAGLASLYATGTWPFTAKPVFNGTSIEQNVQILQDYYKLLYEEGDVIDGFLVSNIQFGVEEPQDYSEIKDKKQAHDFLNKIKEQKELKPSLREKCGRDDTKKKMKDQVQCIKEAKQYANNAVTVEKVEKHIEKLLETLPE